MAKSNDDFTRRSPTFAEDEYERNSSAAATETLPT